MRVKLVKAGMGVTKSWHGRLLESMPPPWLRSHSAVLSLPRQITCHFSRSSHHAASAVFTCRLWWQLNWSEWQGLAWQMGQQCTSLMKWCSAPTLTPELGKRLRMIWFCCNCSHVYPQLQRETVCLMMSPGECNLKVWPWSALHLGDSSYVVMYTEIPWNLFCGIGPMQVVLHNILQWLEEKFPFVLEVSSIIKTIYYLPLDSPNLQPNKGVERAQSRMLCYLTSMLARDCTTDIYHELIVYLVMAVPHLLWPWHFYSHSQ